MTLVEQVMVLGVGGIALASALGALGTGALGLNKATAQDQAHTLALDQMEYVKGQPFVTAPSTYMPGVVVPARYSLSTVAQPFPGGDDNIQKVIITVTQDSKTLITFETWKVKRP